MKKFIVAKILQKDLPYSQRLQNVNINTVVNISYSLYEHCRQYYNSIYSNTFPHESKMAIFQLVTCTLLAYSVNAEPVRPPFPGTIRLEKQNKD